jgi:undecaprenyl-diphosphatase
MNIFQVIIISIVEGLTEFLPISSTAHMDIVRAFLSIQSSDFIKSFEIIIQLGAILSVFVIYFKKIFSSWKNVLNLIIAFIPTGIIGFLLYKIIKSFLLGNIFVMILALLVGGIIIILFENFNKNKKIDEDDTLEIKDMKVRDLIILGIAQSLAVIPGVSRSGAIIICGRALGIGKKLITDFSFLLAIPTMFLAVVYDVYKNGLNFSSDEWGFIVLGFVVAFIVAFIVAKWFLNYIRKHDFRVFGWYRIILAILLILALFFNIL